MELIPPPMLLLEDSPLLHVRLYACYDPMGVDVFSDFPDCLRPFKTLCFFNYALILRQDYDITSSLRRGVLQNVSPDLCIMSDEDENPNLNLNDDDEKEYEEEYVHTLENYESSDDEKEHVEEEEYDLTDEELYEDVNVKLKDAEHGEDGKAYSLKRGRDDKDKDEDPPVGSDQKMKRWKTRKDDESSKGLKSKELKSTSSSKGTTRLQPKSSSKSAQTDEPIHTVNDTKVQQSQGQDMGTTDDQPNVEATSKHDWFKKPERPPTSNSDWNVGKSVDFRPPQT
nr:hypothetical protein [Tanacetum cinerariifolium]